MRLPFRFASRYLSSKKSTNAINLISFISVFGMAVGTAALIIILSIFNGFEGLVDRLYGTFYSEMRVVPAEGKHFVFSDSVVQLIKSDESVLDLTAVIEDNAMLDYDGKRVVAVMKGVDSNFANVSKVADSLHNGRFVLQENGLNHAVLGLGLVYQLDIGSFGLSKALTVSVPKPGVQTSANPLNLINQGKLLVAGSFLIQQEFDQKYILVPLSFAQRLLNREGRVGAYEMALKENSKLNKVQKRLSQALGEKYKVETRYQQHATMYKVMRSEKFIVYLILSFVLVIAAFNIIGSLAMVVIEKKHDINILKVLGMEKKAIRKIFLLHGILQGLIGCLVGLIIAFAFVLAQKQFGLISIPGSGTFAVKHYPVHIEFLDVLGVLLTIFVITLAASWYPANMVAKRAKIQIER